MPEQTCKHLRLSRLFGQQEQQTKEELQQVSPRARVSRHKLTCRKKTVMTAPAGLLMPAMSACRTRVKRSRPAASLEVEGKGKGQHLLGALSLGTAPVTSISVLLLQALSSMRR